MLLTEDGKVPVHWWTHATNFGDLLAPWLVRKISGRDVVYAPRGEQCYVAVGSILSHAKKQSVVWGSGSFGVEAMGNPKKVKNGAKPPDFVHARFCAVRGPLTRNKIVSWGVDCPRIYGDPGLLVSKFYNPVVPKSYEVGVVLRWSEKRLFDRLKLEGVRSILLDSDDIEGTIDAIVSCKRIVSSSLHGLIVADAYGIPNAWLDSKTPLGLEFKYWDYLISVNKVRDPVSFNFRRPKLSLSQMLDELPFDGRAIHIDLDSLMNACPFVPGKEEDTIIQLTASAGDEEKIGNAEA